MKQMVVCPTIRSEGPLKTLAGKGSGVSDVPAQRFLIVTDPKDSSLVVLRQAKTAQLIQQLDNRGSQPLSRFHCSVHFGSPLLAARSWIECIKKSTEGGIAAVVAPLKKVRFTEDDAIKILQHS
jgi:hypothetical protein